MNTVSFDFAISEMRNRGDKIKLWASQNENLLLKSLAAEVVMVAGGKK